MSSGKETEETRLDKAHEYLKTFNYPFNSYDNIKLHLDVKGVPLNLTKPEEIKILRSKLSSPRGTTDLFEFLVCLLKGKIDKIDDITLSLLGEKSISIIQEMTKTGCFGLNRYSSNLNISSFFDGSVPLKIQLDAIIYLSELIHIRRLKKK